MTNCEICGGKAPTTEHATCERWQQRIGMTDRYSNVAVIEGRLYAFGQNNTTGARGFHGRPFQVRRIGDDVISRESNVWYLGTVPAALRHEFPDTAEFAGGVSPVLQQIGLVRVPA